MGYSSGDITERFQWTFPIVIAPTDPDVALRHVAARLEVDQRGPELAADQPGPDAARSVDAGALGRPDHARSDRRRDLRRRSSRSRRRPVDGNVIWAGSDDGCVHVTRDGGKNWKNVTPPDLPAFTRISLIEASPHDAGTAYLAGNRYQQDDRAPYVYRTARLRQDLDEDRQRPDGRRLRARDSRRQEAQGAAVPRHRDRHLRLVRRRRGVAVAAAGPAGHAGARHRGQERRPGDRDARPIVLRDGQHRRAAADLPRDDQRAGRAVQARPTRRDRSRAASRSTTT